jgi:hypothetical protein
MANTTGIARPSPTSIVTPSVAATGAGRVLSPTLSSPIIPMRGNNVAIRLGQNDRLKVVVYLNDITVKRLRSMTGSASFKELRTVVSDLISKYGLESISRLLTNIKIPAPVAKALANMMVRLAMRQFNSGLSHIIQKLNQFAAQSKGISIALTAPLPRDFMRKMLKAPLSLTNLLKQISSTLNMFTIVVHPGYLA